MAFNEQEKKIIEFGKKSGKSRQEVERAIINFRTGKKTSEPAVESALPTQEKRKYSSSLLDKPAIPYLKRVTDAVGEDISKRVDKVGEIINRPNTGLPPKTVGEIPAVKKGVQIFGQGAGMAANAIEKTVGEIPGVKAVAKGIGAGINWLATSELSPIKHLGDQIGKSEALQEAVRLYDTDQDFKDSVDAVANTVRLGGDVEAVVGSANFLKNVTSKFVQDLKKPAVPPPGGAGPDKLVAAEKGFEKGGTTANTVDMDNNLIKSGDYPAAKIYKDPTAKIYQPEVAKQIVSDGVNNLKIHGFPELATKYEKMFGDFSNVTPEQILNNGKAVAGGVPGLAEKISAGTGAAPTGLLSEAVNNAKTTLFGKAGDLSSIDDVVKKANEGLAPSEVLKASEGASAKPSILEKWAGISPDIKNRIAGKQGKLKEYFDVAHARNNFDTLPTALEHGTKSVQSALTIMEKVLNDTGSQIGQFRKKVSTYKASIDDVNKIDAAFNNELSKLNLEVKNGTIKQKPGTVTRVNSDAEIKVLNDLFGELQTVKQSPSLEKLIDLRNLFDSRINFAKSSREVSSSLDPASRNIRKQIADTAATIVGKSEAGNLTKYSEFIDAYNELKSFTDRKAGAEFLLKQVLSEKGATSREIIQTIKDITGIDLMDDAVMASIATDLIGNSRQKSLFRQEITKAGLDTKAALTGDPVGAIRLMFNFLSKGLINEEKQFLKAAGGNLPPNNLSGGK